MRAPFPDFAPHIVAGSANGRCTGDQPTKHGMGFTYSIFLQIERILHPTEFVHPRVRPRFSLKLGAEARTVIGGGSAISRLPPI